MPQTSHREALITGAMSCLLAQGYGRTTARDIASASGANLASIGYHFGSKEALLNEALIRILEERTKLIGEVMRASEEASSRDRITTAFAAVRTLFESFRPVLLAFLEAMVQAERSPDLRQAMAEHYRHTRDAVAAMVKESLGTDAERLHTDPNAMASFLVAALDGLLVQWLLSPADTPSAEDLVAALADTMALVAQQDSGRSQVGGANQPL